MTNSRAKTTSKVSGKQFLVLSLTLAGLHAAAMVLAFLIFGLGLEGAPVVGQKILPILAQPMISLPITGAPAIVQNLLIFISSLIWGAAIAGLFCLYRNWKVNTSAMSS